MTFKWKIIRPTPQVQAGELGVTGVGIECETGQMGAEDFLAAIQREESAFVTIFGGNIIAGVRQTIAEDQDEQEPTTAPGETEKPRRTRGPNKKAPEAVAPAPLPVPTEADPLAIPENLKRTDPPAPVAPAAAAPPPPPVMPSAPPIAPAAPTPPTGVLAEKVIADLDKRKVGAADGGAALVDWLAAPSVGLVTKGATYDEAMSVLRMTSDEKLAAVAGALGVST